MTWSWRPLRRVSILVMGWGIESNPELKLAIRFGRTAVYKNWLADVTMSAWWWTLSVGLHWIARHETAGIGVQGD